MIDDILNYEWAFFQDVHHIEGRASCQDDFETFYLQRKSQFEAFDPQVNESWLNDLKQAKLDGRNPIMEKYAYMMESTDPQLFSQIKDQLPIIEKSQKELIDSLCQIEVSMREEMDQKYPHLLSQARLTHTFQDEKEDTSFETYLRGELMTYSPHTLYLYGQMIVTMLKKQENLIEKILTHTVLAYGYHSLQEADNFMMRMEKK